MSDTWRVTTADGSRLAVDVYDGGGPPGFLLVHGLASNALLWSGVARRLAEAGQTAAAVDQRGHGRSDQPATGYDLATACDDLGRVLDELADRVAGFGTAPIVAGQSWGATVALEFGRLHPERVAGVVCVDGGTMDLSARFPTWQECAAALAPPRTAGRRAADIETMLRRMHPDWPDEGIAATMGNFEVRPDGTVAPRLDFDHHMQLLHALWSFHPADVYRRLRVPVLIVPAGGGSSPWASDKQASVDAAVAAIPRSRAEWFSPADHDLHAQHPDRLAELLRKEAATGLFA